MTRSAVRDSLAAPVIEVCGVVRRYGDRRALDGVDLRLAPAEIVALVGPNGSGKTTLLSILAGFQRPHGGEVRVFGHAPFRERAAVMRRARFAFAPPALFESLTAREHLRYLPALGAARPTSSEIARALDLVGLAERADERVHAFSLGMRQRLVLAQALLPVPELIVLDEPTEGLDPLAVLELREVLKQLRSEHGVAVLLSSHLLVEVDQLVDRLLVLDEGRPLFDGTPAQLRSGGARLIVEVEQPARAAALLVTHGHAAQVEDGQVLLSPGSLSLEAARALLATAGLALAGYHVRERTLEEALLERLRARPSSRRVEAEQAQPASQA